MMGFFLSSRIQNGTLIVPSADDQADQLNPCFSNMGEHGTSSFLSMAEYQPESIAAILQNA
jgi:hypothetical protein